MRPSRDRLPDNLRSIVDGLGRQALHAAELGFEHPTTGEEMFFDAPLPPRSGGTCRPRSSLSIRAFAR